MAALEGIRNISGAPVLSCRSLERPRLSHRTASTCSRHPTTGFWVWWKRSLALTPRCGYRQARFRLPQLDDVQHCMLQSKGAHGHIDHQAARSVRPAMGAQGRHTWCREIAAARRLLPRDRRFSAVFRDKSKGIREVVPVRRG
jgi:hypothetical protein